MLYVPKKNKSEKHQQQKLCSKIYSIKKRQEESSRNVYSGDLEDSLGKEELRLRKITIFDVWNYYSIAIIIFFLFYSIES